MNEIKSKKKNNLGKYVFFALILGLVIGQLIRFSISNPEILQSISSQLNIITGMFLRLIKMIIAPLIFSTLVVGISKLGDAKALGRIFFKTMFIFIVGSVIALAVGLMIVDFFEPGKVLGQSLLAHNPDVPNGAQANLVSNLSLKSFLEKIIPSSVVDSFANNNIIQIVIFSLFFGIAGVAIGKPVAPVFDFFELVSRLMFKVTDYVMMFAPIAVFCAISTVIIKDGFGILSSYIIYLLEFLLSVVILWTIMIGIGYLILGRKVFSLIKALADSLGVAFSTSSSESVLPNVLEELDKFGVQSKISGFVLPLGYSFNLIASTLNCIFATMFIVQAYGYTLTIGQKIAMCFTLMITSKGIAGIPRVSLVIVAATLASMGIPEAAVLILFPIDSFLDMLRSATNVFANALSATIVDKWEK
jgi:Na+/H+-dicarboxylate symporter